MKFASLASCALFASAISGCMVGADQSPNGELGSTKQAIENGPNGPNDPPLPPIAGTPLFAKYFPDTKEIDVQTCDISHPGMLDPSNPADFPCLALYPDRHLQVVNVVVVNARGRIVGDNIHGDRPGGGCIHLSVPNAVAGGKLYIVAVGKNLDGSGRTREQFYLFNVGT